MPSPRDIIASEIAVMFTDEQPHAQHADWLLDALEKAGYRIVHVSELFNPEPLSEEHLSELRARYEERYGA